MRKTYTWKLPRTELVLGTHTIVMGILNITPDSFYDGGVYLDQAAALDRAQEMQEQGADILDIGGESSRPGSKPVSEEEELRRVLPIVEKLSHRLTIPISIDTYRSQVARRTIEAGAQIINDISAFRFDPVMPNVVQETGAGIVLMHSRGSREELHQQPPMPDPIGEVRSRLEIATRHAAAIGIVRSAVVVDPGIGFGMRAEESVSVLHNLQAVSQLEYPLLVGTSRKSFLRRFVSNGQHAEGNDRLWSTAASVASAIHSGAHIVRVHDVAEIRIFVDVLDSL